MGRYPSTYVNSLGPRKRLTVADVEMIHAHRSTTTAELARQMGFSETTIHNVRVGNTWPELHPAHPSNQDAVQPRHVERTSPGYSEALLQDPPVAQANQETIQSLMAQLGGENPQALTFPAAPDPQVSYPSNVQDDGAMFGDNVI